MNKCRLNSLVIALLLLVPCLAFALPGAHDPTSGGYAIVCNSCHVQPKTFGNTNANYTDNVCLTCHLSGTNNTKKVFRKEDFADIAGTAAAVRGVATPIQSSHKWFGSDVVPKAGAQAPTDTSANGLNKNSSFTGSLSCARCHNVHGSSGLQSNTAPFLRNANDADQMCRDCHRSRDVVTTTPGSHPVNVIYSSAYKANPTLFRAQPDSGNANSQLKIVSGKVLCSSCHKVHAADSRTGSFDNYTTGHAFTNLSSSNGALLRVSPYGKTATDINICTNCHTNKKSHNLTLRAGKPAAQCNDCHSGHVEYDPAATGGETTPNIYVVRRYLQYSTAGRLSKRIIFNSAASKNFYSATGGGVCQSCHNPPLDHLSGANIEPGHTACMTCHSHADAAGSFSVSSGGCTSCHGNPPVSAATKAAGYTGNEDTSPHISHAGGAANYSYGCVQCHNGSAGSGVTHKNGIYNDGEFVTKVAVTAGGIISGPNAAYNGTSCSNVYCHSDGTSTTTLGSPKIVTWAGGLNTISTCDACHASSPVTGSHTKHMSVAGYGCATCHSATVSSNTVISNLSNHVNAVKDVQFSGVGAANGATCSVVSCHSNGKSAPPVVTPVWGTASTGTCNSCHLTATGTALATGSHTKHFTVIGSTDPTVVCIKCHTYNGETVAPHVDGTLDVLSSASSCGTCHNSGQGPTGTSTGITAGSPTWGAGTLSCNACHKNMKTDATAPGSHVVHAQTRSIACSVCHNGYTETTATPATHTDGNVNLSFTTPAASTTYSQGNSGVLGNGYGSCSTSYCHSSGQAANGSATPVYPAAAPTWGGAVMTCASCHKNMDTDAAATGSHIKHAQGTYNIACASCHNGYTETTATPATHVDGNVNLGFAGTAVGTTYSQGNAGAAGNGFGSCSTSYCHSSGQAANGTATPVYAATAPTWGGAALGCGSCHKNMDTDAAATGSHIKHAQGTLNFACATCHNGYTESTAAVATHVDGNVNLGFAGAAAGTTYSQGNTGAAGNGFGSCSTSKCHSSGQAADGTATPTYATPTWGGAALGCASCHKNMKTDATAPGSHVVHAQTRAIACAVCHNGYTETTASVATHADGNVNLAFTAPAASTVYSQGTSSALGNGFGSCATSYCHSSGQAANGTATPIYPAAAPTWGGAALTCGSCHKNMDTDAAATGSHIKHAQGVLNIACATCHSGYTETTATPATHVDGNINLGFAGAAAGTTYSQGVSGAAGNGFGSCSTSKCHSTGQAANGTATPVYATAPTWGGAALTCGSCHKNMDTDTSAPGSHVLHAQGTTNIACSVCHNGYTETTAAVATHADGNVNLSFTAPAATTVYSQGNSGALGNGYGTCSTSVCHGSSTPTWGANTSNVTCTKCHGKPTLTNYSTTNAWQAAPGYAQTSGSGTYTNNVSDTAPYGAHDAHVRAVNQYTTRQTLCSDCHGTLPTSGTHANGLTMSFSDLAKNIGTSGGSVTTGPSTRGTLNPTYSAGTCSAVYCHGGVMAGTDTTPEWRYTGTSYLTTYAKNVTNCGKCHAALPVVAAKDHSSMTFATQSCTGCHGHEGNGSKHIDGILQASGACDGCHGYQPGSWAGATAINPEGKGAHEAHIVWLTTKRFTQTLNPATDSYASASTAWTNVCGICHGSNLSNHNTGTVNVILDSAYSFGSAPAYKGTPGVSSATVGSEKTCSNISCHYFTTPLWSTY